MSGRDTLHLRVTGDILEAFGVDVTVPRGISYESDEFAHILGDAIGGHLKLGREHALRISEIIPLDTNGNELDEDLPEPDPCAKPGTGLIEEPAHRNDQCRRAHV